jgi:hypothetical protein
MGRLTLNVLLSFAQFEREVTGERIRDKIAASKKKGIWMGGQVPLGYRVEKRKLLIDESEAATVRLIFERYVALGSLPALQRELRERGVLTRPRLLSSGATVGGVHFSNGPLAHLLRNRVYLGANFGGGGRLIVPNRVLYWAMNYAVVRYPPASVEAGQSEVKAGDLRCLIDHLIRVMWVPAWVPRWARCSAQTSR